MKISNKFFLAAIMMIGTIVMMDRCKSPTTSKETSDTTIKDTTVVAAKAPDTTSAIVAKTKDTAKVAVQEPLTLTITNLASLTAPVYVGVYGTQNKFPDPKDQLKEYKFIPHGKELIAKITDLHFGTYALAIYQDVNSNGKIDKNLIGIPTEGYAFSRNFKPKVKAPGFDNCKFDYDAKDNTLTMNLIQ